MAEQPQEELVEHEVVGRRIRDNHEHHGITDGDGGFRVLAGAFMEDRPDAHISVDRFWNNTKAPSKAGKAAHTHLIAEICISESWDGMKGWACTSVKRFKTVHGIHSVIATPKPNQNPHHADLVKQDFLVIKTDDSRGIRRSKSIMLAQQLADSFNTFLKENQAEFIPWPSMPQAAHA
ncbi:hypothetical protein AZ34_00450 [Hylemonella gracilis str. Niagara R]|uniref:Uncharacterized protein n=1 Tax=Hylemonella gracilis str. Niagara R TaxID=1458275 RepID=A0A016XLG0_9BURK|nr:hypothetical protein [Hylemonella gracilis]EYC52740.1 hypothetical protein AZ34_00450 [Hylemonella gracilis str. Niagara R]